MPVKISPPLTISVLLIFSLLLMINPQAQAKTGRAKLTAVYLFRLAENIQWANKAQIQSYRLHLIDSSSQIQNQLSGIAKIKKLHGKSFLVTRSSGTEIPTDTHLIYVSKEKVKEYPTIFKRVEGRNILLISDNLADKRHLMINLLDDESQKISFEINRANIINQHLTIRPDIILLGGTEIDVAKLYKQSQISLRAKEQHVADIEAKRITLEKNILKAHKETAELESKLSQQLTFLNQQKDRAGDMEKLIQEKEVQVKAEQERLKQIEQKSAEQQKIIDQQKKAYTETKLLNRSLAENNRGQQQTIDKQKRLINQERDEYDALTRHVKEREVSLKEQAKQIKARTSILNELDEKIARQDTALADQSETIINQRSFLTAISIATVLLIFLAIAIYRSYRLKRKANAKLLVQQRLLQQSTEALAKAKESAETANHAKSSFLANMSHELRTPLNAVLGFSNLMQNDPLTSETQQESLSIINRSGSHLLQLINDVLDMSKIEVGRIKLELIDFDLGALVREVIDMMQVNAEEKGIQLLLDQSSKFPRFIHGDESKLRQILINLISNSIKFTDTGGVSLRLDSDNGHPDIFTLRIEVEDSGLGIAPEDIERIFLPFEQLTDSASQKGTGLGLAITQQFVELMEGSIQVESELGKGSLFSVQINVQHAQESVNIGRGGEKPQIISLAKGSEEYRILIAEDQRENQLLLLRLLESTGFRIKIVGNGEQAVKLFKQWKPHFIWMDRRMPIMNGLVATRKIRELPGGKDVKIVALTASVFRQQKEEVLDAGSDDYIRKPYKPEEIFFCMKKHLGLHYIYRERNNSVSQHQVLENKTVDRTEFAEIEHELLDELLKAAMAADGEKILQLSTKLPETVQSTLKQLVNGYHYDSIVEHCKQSKRGVA